MRTILFINACVRRESRTYYLAQEALQKLDGTVIEVNLEKENIQPLNGERLALRNQYSSRNDFSAPAFRYARQFAAADEIVIAAPYWDLAFPAMVKNYLEAVTVTGVTFRYTKEGIPEGLCKAERIIYVTTAGGPIGKNNFGFEYIKGLAETFYGTKKIECFKAENLDIIGNDAWAIVEKTAAEIRNSIGNEKKGAGE